MAQPYDLLVGLMLLTAPVGTPEQVPDADRWPGIRDGVHHHAIRLEIMDPREKAYVFARVEDFENDLELLRRRYQELKDAPPLSDAERLPPRETCNAFIQFNRAFRKNMQERLVWEQDRADIFTAVIQETDTLYRAWDKIRDARCDFYYVSVRRRGLLDLRTMIGEKAYNENRLPEYVPIWRFNERR